jgi:hypothetical protein
MNYPTTTQEKETSMTHLDNLIDRLIELRDGGENITSVHLLNPDIDTAASCPFVDGLVLFNTGVVYLTDLSEQQVNDAGYKNLLQEYIPVSERKKYVVEIYVSWPAAIWMSVFTSTDRKKTEEFQHQFDSSVETRIRTK